MYYSSNKIDTYQRLFNFIVGLRGVGKTYHFTEKSIETGIKTKKPSFVWVRRMKADIDAIKGTWMNDVEHLFPDYFIETESYGIYARSKKNNERYCIGFFIALSDYIRAKSRPYPYVQYIIFDEFLVEDGKYLPNETDKFLNLCDSIIRNRENCKVYLIGNASSMLNPYFDMFNIKGDELMNNFVKGKHYVIENTDYQEFKQARINSKLGQVIKDTAYGRYSIDNKFYLDDTSDICKMPIGTKVMLYNLRLNDKLIAVYLINGLVYFAKGYDETYTTYTFYPQDAKKYGCIFQTSKSSYLKSLVKEFLNGTCQYENLQVKNEIQLLVRLVYKNW